MEEEIDTLKLEDISGLFKIGCIVLTATFLFQTVGMATNHWTVSKTDTYGTVQYNGLWEICADVRIGLFIVIACIVFGSLKDVQKPRRMQGAYVTLSWSFAFNLIGGLLSFATGVFFVISS